MTPRSFRIGFHTFGWCFLLACALHRAQFHLGGDYSRSPLLYPVTFGAIILIACFVIFLISALVLKIRGNREWAGTLGELSVASFLYFFAAMYIDAPTLIFGT